LEAKKALRGQQDSCSVVAPWTCIPISRDKANSNS
jgi:hypothetical protein